MTSENAAFYFQLYDHEELLTTVAVGADLLHSLSPCVFDPFADPFHSGVDHTLIWVQIRVLEG